MIISAALQRRFTPVTLLILFVFLLSGCPDTPLPPTTDMEFETIDHDSLEAVRLDFQNGLSDFDRRWAALSASEKDQANLIASALIGGAAEASLVTLDSVAMTGGIDGIDLMVLLQSLREIVERVPTLTSPGDRLTEAQSAFLESAQHLSSIVQVDVIPAVAAAYAGAHRHDRFVRAGGYHYEQFEVQLVHGEATDIVFERNTNGPTFASLICGYATEGIMIGNQVDVRARFQDLFTGETLAELSGLGRIDNLWEEGSTLDEQPRARRLRIEGLGLQADEQGRCMVTLDYPRHYRQQVAQIRVLAGAERTAHLARLDSIRQELAAMNALITALPAEVAAEHVVSVLTHHASLLAAFSANSLAPWMIQQFPDRIDEVGPMDPLTVDRVEATATVVEFQTTRLNHLLIPHSPLSALATKLTVMLDVIYEAATAAR